MVRISGALAKKPRDARPNVNAIAGRGYHAVYRPGEINRCPSCGMANWHVGRSMAECGFCQMPLAIANNGQDQ